MAVSQAKKRPNVPAPTDRVRHKPVGARLAGDGDLAVAIAGKPGSYRDCVAQLDRFRASNGSSCSHEDSIFRSSSSSARVLPRLIAINGLP